MYRQDTTFPFTKFYKVIITYTWCKISSIPLFSLVQNTVWYIVLQFFWLKNRSVFVR